MKSKPRKTGSGNFQECKIIPITDPAEIAALERRIQAAEKAFARAEGRQPKARKPVRSTLVGCELVEITDPAEIAERERRVRAAEKALATREKALAARENGGKSKSRKGK